MYIFIYILYNKYVACITYYYHFIKELTLFILRPHFHFFFFKAMKKTISFVGNLKFAKDVSESSYGHAEFVFGKDLYKLLFSDIVDFFDSVSGKSNSVI